MARNAFNVDHDILRKELNTLSDGKLKERHDDAWDSLFGPNSDSEDFVQDFSLFEEMAITNRAELKIAEEIMKARKEGSIQPPDTDEAALEL